MHGNFNAAKLAQALGPVARPAPVPACRSISLAVRARSPSKMLDFVGFDQTRQQRARSCGELAPTRRAGSSTCRRTIEPRPWCVEYRDLKGRFDPDPIVAAGLGSDIPALPTKGGYKVDVALCGTRCADPGATFPALELLEADGAVRYSHYDTSTGSSFSHTTFKASINWKPISGPKAAGRLFAGLPRAQHRRIVRHAPSRFDQEVHDPCSADSPPQNPTGTVLANCIKHGVPPRQCSRSTFSFR